ncbi:MAG: hypothetical protein RMK29_00870 [Myxococcales bacterium]|nr:hypothetical protein [Myxococcota bacterium]MDW8280230.1 hypothetical protein [Myxococcales bacterium]
MFPSAFVCYRCGRTLSRAQVRFDLFHAGERLLPRCAHRSDCAPQPELPRPERRHGIGAEPGRVPICDHPLVENG